MSPTRTRRSDQGPGTRSGRGRRTCDDAASSCVANSNVSTIDESEVNCPVVVIDSEDLTPFGRHQSSQEPASGPAESSSLASQIAEDIAASAANQAIDDSSDQQPVQDFNVDGTQDISRALLARIVSLAAEEVPGIVPPRMDFRTRVEDLIRGRRGGIRVDVGTTEAAVDILARVQYGADIHRTATLLKKTVASRMSQMTGLKVVEVNLIIQDIVPGSAL